MEVPMHEEEDPSVRNEMTVSHRYPLTEADITTTAAKLIVTFRSWTECTVVKFQFTTCHFLSEPTPSSILPVVDQMLTKFQEYHPGQVDFSDYRTHVVNTLCSLPREISCSGGKEFKITFYIGNDLDSVYGLKKVRYGEQSPNLQACFDQKTCCVCLDNFVDGVPVTMLNCLHIFHDDCLQKWLKKKASCPVCRSRVVRLKEERSQSSRRFWCVRLSV